MSFKATAGAAPTTPASGKAQLYVDSADKSWKQIDDTGSIRPLGMDAPTAIAATSGAINTTETIIVGGLNNCRLLPNQCKVGTTFRITLEGTCTSTVANASTWRIRIGTAGTTSDAAVFTAANSVAAASGTNIPFEAVLMLTVRTIGASASIQGYLKLGNTGVTGISAVTWQAVEATALTFDSTVANWISATYVAAAVTTTCTFRQATIEIVKI